MLIHCSGKFIAAESVELIYQYKLKCLFCAVFNHTLEIGTVVRCTRYCLVYVGVDYEYVVAFGIVLANSQLPLDRLFCLFIA